MKSWNALYLLKDEEYGESSTTDDSYAYANSTGLFEKIDTLEKRVSDLQEAFHKS